MENFHSFGWCENADLAQCQTQMDAGSYPCHIPLFVGDSFHDQFLAPQMGAGFDDGVEDYGTVTAASSSKSHSEAEKRRRDRINGQLHTLRKLISKSEKMDKATLLASAVEHVKEMKIRAAEVSQTLTVPTEVDEIRISTYTADHDNIFIEVSMCCEDRPELFAELDKAFQGLSLSMVRAEIASVGGRIQSILLLSCDGVTNQDSGKPEPRESKLSSLKRSLQTALKRIVDSAPAVSSYRVASKRQRFFFSSNS